MEHRFLPDDAPELTDPGVTVLDQRDAQRRDLAALRTDRPDDETGTWVYYPWRRTAVAVLNESAFRRLRTDRNRNKITAAEQERLGSLTIGVAGLSVGHAVAYTLALEGLGGELRLADFDALDLSNLNRIPASVLDLGVNKAVVAARRIAELDPYLRTRTFTDGITADNLDAFLDGLDILVEEADSLDVKVLLRERARARGIPVLMVTSDRGLLDVERFDLEPDRPLFHGLVGDLDSASLAALATKDKVPHVMRILGASELSPRIAASMVEVGTTLSTWPQLGGDVELGGATVAAAVRRLGLGRELASGRIRVDLEEDLDALDATPPEESSGTPESPDDPYDDEMLEAVRRAPSGGNVQPWHVETDAAGLRLHLDRTRTTTMDVAFRGSYVALGAALFNARVAASRQGRLGPVTILPDEARPDLVATLTFGHGHDERLDAVDVLARGTDRALGVPRPLRTSDRLTLDGAARDEGGRLRLLEPGPVLDHAADAMAEADRVRYLTATLHREMFAELVDAGATSGIDVAALGLDDADLAKLAIARRPEVMTLLADWDAGAALADDTRDRVRSSSALAVVTVDGAAPADFVRGGQAVESVWVTAQALGLAVHPVSPVFLFAVEDADLDELSPTLAGELGRARRDFRLAAGLDPGEQVALVLRLSHVRGDSPPPRSRRRPVGEILRHA